MLQAGPYPGLAAAVAGAAVAGGLLAGCAATTAQTIPGAGPAADAAAEPGFAPGYRGVQALRQSGDIVEISVEMAGARDKRGIGAYARCVAAQYALSRGYGFARHVVTNVSFEGGVWRADAVYTISRALPAGLRRIDAEVTVQNCVAQGIPTV